jgi:four helix bundle protein
MFPKCELYGLTSQMRRAAVSVASNIAGGKGRLSDKDLIVFRQRARGSLLELRTQIQLAQNLNSLRRGGDEKLMTMPEDHAQSPRLILGKWL